MNENTYNNVSLNENNGLVYTISHIDLDINYVKDSNSSTIFALQLKIFQSYADSIILGVITTKNEN